MSRKLISKIIFALLLLCIRIDAYGLSVILPLAGNGLLIISLYQSKSYHLYFNKALKATYFNALLASLTILAKCFYLDAIVYQALEVICVISLTAITQNILFGFRELMASIQQHDYVRRLQRAGNLLLLFMAYFLLFFAFAISWIMVLPGLLGSAILIYILHLLYSCGEFLDNPAIRESIAGPERKTPYLYPIVLSLATIVLVAVSLSFSNRITTEYSDYIKNDLSLPQTAAREHLLSSGLDEETLNDLPDSIIKGTEEAKLAIQNESAEINGGRLLLQYIELFYKDGSYESILHYRWAEKPKASYQDVIVLSIRDEFRSDATLALGGCLFDKGGETYRYDQLDVEVISGDISCPSYTRYDNPRGYIKYTGGYAKSWYDNEPQMMQTGYVPALYIYQKSFFNYPYIPTREYAKYREGLYMNDHILPGFREMYYQSLFVGTDSPAEEAAPSLSFAPTADIE